MWSLPWVVLGALAAGSLSAQGLPFATYRSDDGLAQGVVLALAQDRDGFLWAGTPDGLSRFDGILFTTFSTADGLPNDVVRAVFEARDGTIWLGTDAGIGRRPRGAKSFTATPEIDGTTLGSVRAIAETPDGAVWFGLYDHGIVRLDPSGRSTLLGTAAGLPNPQVRALRADRQGRLWAGTYGGGVALITSGSVVTFGTDQGLANLFVRSLGLDQAGRLLVGTDDGLYRLNGDRFELFVAASAFGNSEVSALATDAAGRVWAGTRDRGACRIDDVGTTHCLGLADGLADNGVNAVLSDREGSLWFGTFGGGISRLRSEDFQIWTTRHGLPYDTVSALAEGPPGVLWIGTHGGGVARLEGKEVAVYGLAEGLPHEKVVAAMSTRSGSTWFGTLDGAARLGSDGRFDVLSVRDGLPSATVLSLGEGPDGQVWVGTTAGLALASDTDPPRLLEPVELEGLPIRRSRINCIERDGDAMWLGTGDGLVRWKNGELNNWSVAAGLPDGFIQALHRAPDGALWVGTAKGLARFQYGVFRIWPTGGPNGLIHHKIQAITEDATGRLWVGTTRGISIIDGATTRSLTTRDGLVSAEVTQEAILLDSRGRLWVGTVGGAISFLPETQSHPVIAPTVHLTEVLAGARSMPLTGPLELTRDMSDVTFSFVGISLAQAGDIVYDVELEGFDAQPRRTVNRSVVYAAIPPGQYRFSVRALARGVPSVEAATIEIEVQPAFWNTWWFQLGVLLLVGSTAWSLHRSRLRGMRRRNAELQELLTQREQAEAAVRRYAGELEHKSLHDTLTDLPNRALLLDRVAVALERSRAAGKTSTCAILCLDLDDFKLINDSRGHDAGDRVLLEMTDRLLATMRPGDTLASLGGDDFVVLLAEVHGAVEATRIGQELQAAIARPCEVDGQEVVLSGSVGIAIDAGRYRRPDDLLRDADTALYRAKARGSGQCAIFDSAMYENTVRQLQLGTDLRRAVERNELRLLYQPIRRLSDGKIGHFEALLRWQHPQRGLLSPAEFLEHLQEVGLTEAAGEWVLRAACEQLAMWSRRFTPPPRIAVNLFSSQVLQLDLADRIRAILTELDLSPEQIGLEVTEGVLIEDPTTAIVSLAKVRTLAIEVSLDDFGTGYSSLSYLERFPVDVLKIDRSFISRLDASNDSSRIVESILQLARSLGLRVVAEGVETEAQLERLRSLGCDYVQGYFVARPLTPEQAEAFLESESVARLAALG